MFQFPALAPFRVTMLAHGRVSPFGHPEITARVQLPQAYRSLPRPSSPLDAKASTVCLIAFDLTSVGTSFFGVIPSPDTTQTSGQHPHIIPPSVVKEPSNGMGENREVRATPETFHHATQT